MYYNITNQINLYSWDYKISIMLRLRMKDLARRSMSTFQYQSTLPKLPVPSLEETAKRYLRSVQPLQTPAEHSHTTTLVHEFIQPNGLGQVLQKRLEERAQTHPNWLEEWWFRYAYHSWRNNVLVHSNWFMLLKNHPMTPRELMDDAMIWKRQGVVTPFQVDRAAVLVSNMVGYIQELVA